MAWICAGFWNYLVMVYKGSGKTLDNRLWSYMLREDKSDIDHIGFDWLKWRKVGMSIRNATEEEKM